MKMTLEEAYEKIEEYSYLIGTRPFEITIHSLYPTPSNGKNHDKIVGALILNNSITPYLNGYDEFSVNVLYYEYRDVTFFESLDILLKKLEE